MDLELDGKVAVVTGAGKGIGLAIVKALAAEGALVVAGSRSSATLDGIDGVTGVAIDLSAPDAPAALVQRALDEHGRVDVLVNNVGAVKLRMDGFLAVDDGEFQRAFDLNFFIALRATRAAVTAMLEQRRRRDRQHRLGQRLLRARRRHDRLRRREGGAAEPQQVAVAGAGAARDPRQLHLAGTGRDRPVARRGRRRRHRRESVRHRRRHRAGKRRRLDRRLRDRALHDPGGGRDARRHARLRAHRQRHRRELGDRRRADQDDVAGGRLKAA